MSSIHSHEFGYLEPTTLALHPIDPYPKADGGKDAWLFLAGCFIMEGVVWGLPFSFGVFQDYYSQHAPFADRPGIAIIGTTSTSILYLGSPIVFIALKRWTNLRRLSNLLGLLFMVTGLITASFAEEVWHLVLSQGFLYGMGGSMFYCPCILYMDEWFKKRQGLAFGIMWAGTGLGGLVIPFILQFTMEKFGFRNVLRAWAITFVPKMALLGPLVYFLKSRVPAEPNVTLRSMNFKFLRIRKFWLYQVPNIIQGFGYFIPGIYLPSYAKTRDMPPISGPLAVALLNAALVVGTIALGAQTDRLHVTTVIVISTTGSAIAVFVLWGISISLPALCVFSLVYGFFAGPYSTCWSAIVKNIQKDNATADTGLVFGMFLAGRGVGNLVSGPVSELLLRREAWSRQADLAYGTKYGNLIIFVGTTAFFGGASWVARRFKLL